MTGEQIRVLIADDQALLRGSMRVRIKTEPDLVVVGEAGIGTEAVEPVQEVSTDVALMDVRMLDIDGIEATRKITAHQQAPKILVLTTFDVDDYMHSALPAGARGFLLKNMAPAQLLDAVRVIAAGEALLVPTVTRRLIAEFIRAVGVAADTLLRGYYWLL